MLTAKRNVGTTCEQTKNQEALARGLNWIVVVCFELSWRQTQHWQRFGSKLFDSSLILS